MTDPAADAGAEAARRRGPAFIVAVTLAVLFGVVAVVLGVLVLVEDSDGEDLSDLRHAAGLFGEALVTYDFHDPDAHRDGVLDLATGSFRQDYEDAFDRGLGQIITQVQAVSRGSVNDVYLTSVDDEQAQAIVSLDIEVSGTSGERTLLDQYVLLTLVRVGGEWKVDQVTDLSFPSTGSGAAPVTADTTTTTAGPPDSSVP
jgi:Mce-associated membrane protein